MSNSHPVHIQNLLSNIKEIRRLLDIHSKVAGAGPGFKPNVEVLNKSAVVLLVACWEAFVEDLASAAFESLLSDATSAEPFPARVLALASEGLRADKDARAVWRLSGHGWKQVLKDHKAAIIAQLVGRLNTPRPKQVDEIFERLIGLSSISSTWSWKGMANDQAVARLDRLVTLRGQIAHRVATSRAVRKEYVIRHIWFVARLSVISSNRTRDHVHSRIAKYPWEQYVSGKTK